MPSRFVTLVLFVLVSALAGPAAAQDRGRLDMASDEHPLPANTDFNLITAIDVSGSITERDEWLEYTGLAMGVLDKTFLARIAEGTQQQIGFMAFTWSSGNQISVVVPWTVIHTLEDAQRVAAQLKAAPRMDRSGYGTYRPSRVDTGGGGLTDIAGAVETALRRSMTAPFAAPRSVINILSNGVDNDGESPTVARDQAVALGVTINGVVFGTQPGLPDYFQNNVIGGPGAFLMSISEPEDLPKALRRKFWQDMVAGLAAPANG